MTLREYIEKYVSKENRKGEADRLKPLPENILNAYIRVAVYLRKVFGKK